MSLVVCRILCGGALCAALTLLGCAESKMAETPVPDGGAPKGPHPTDWVFDATKIHSYSFTVSAAAWKLIEDPPLADPNRPRAMDNPLLDRQEVMAKLVVDGGEDVGVVRFRLKGQASLNDCRSLAFLKARPEDKLCRRPSFKVKFDEYDPDKRFHGLRNLNFNSGIFDGTHLRPWVVMKMFREMGVLAPRAHFAWLEVFVEGDPKPVRQGVYPMVEEIDGRFTDYHFPRGEGDGTVYKDRWFGPGADAAYFAQPDLVESNKMAANHRKVLAFSEAVARAKEGELPGLVDRWMNADYLWRYAAVDRALRHWDGPFTVYQFMPMSGHNFFVYEDQVRDRVWLIPWDTDQAMVGWNGWDNAPAWDEPTTDCVTKVGPNNVPSACDPIWRGLAARGRDGYDKAVDKLLAGPFELTKLFADMDAVIRVIEPALRKEKGTGYDRWLAVDIASFKKSLEVHRDRLTMIRAGKPLARQQFGLKPDTPVAFDDLPRFDFFMGSSATSSTRSRAVQDLNAMGAMRGTHEARATFELRNEDMGGNNQQGGFRIRVNPMAADWKALKAIKLRLRADGARPIRINLLGTNIRHGWTVMASPQASEHTLQASELTLSPGSTGELGTLLAKVENLELLAWPKERGADGRIPGDSADPGWVAIDDLEIVTR